MKKARLYVVFIGRTPGIYYSWADAEKEVIGYSGAKYRRFTCLDFAERALASGDPNYQDPPDGRDPF